MFGDFAKAFNLFGPQDGFGAQPAQQPDALGLPQIGNTAPQPAAWGGSTGPMPINRYGSPQVEQGDHGPNIGDKFDIQGDWKSRQANPSPLAPASPMAPQQQTPGAPHVLR